MTTTWTGEFELAGWDEDTYADLEGERKLTRASVKQSFTGDLTGTGEVEWLMGYGDDGTAGFVGLQQIESEGDGRNGHLVVTSNGGFDGATVTGTWTVVPGCGTGDFIDLEGEGGFEAPMGSKATYHFTPAAG